MEYRPYFLAREWVRVGHEASNFFPDMNILLPKTSATTPR